MCGRSLRAAVTLAASALACSSSTEPQPHDAGTDAASDASFDCAGALTALVDVRSSAEACSAGDTCAATVTDFCCPLYVTSSTSAAAQAFEQAFAAYHAAGCPPTLCEAKACSITSVCNAGRCAQP